MSPATAYGPHVRTADGKAMAPRSIASSTGFGAGADLAGFDVVGVDAGGVADVDATAATGAVSAASASTSADAVASSGTSVGANCPSMHSTN